MRNRLAPWFLLLAASAGAQAPDMSGTWTAVVGEAPPGLPAAPSAILGARFGLRVDARTVTLTALAGQVSVVSALPLDGTEITVAVPGPTCIGERTIHQTATWDAGTLVITTVGSTPAGGNRIVGGPRYLLRAAGADRLVVESSMVQQGQRRQVGVVYQRTSDTLPPPPPRLPIAGASATIGQVAWIGATWSVTSANGVTTEERWTPPAGGAMIGVSRTMRGTAMAAYELLCIVERSGSLVYFAMPNGRTPATPFVATSVTPDSVTFENPSHDYPQLIRYVRTADGGLETVVAGAGGARPQRVTLSRAASP